MLVACEKQAYYFGIQGDVWCPVISCSNDKNNELINDSSLIMEHDGIRIGIIRQGFNESNDCYEWVLAIENSSDETVAVSMYDVFINEEQDDPFPDSKINGEYVEVGDGTSVYWYIYSSGMLWDKIPNLDFKIEIYGEGRGKIINKDDKVYSIEPEGL